MSVCRRSKDLLFDLEHVGFVMHGKCAIKMFVSAKFWINACFVDQKTHIKKFLFKINDIFLILIKSINGHIKQRIRNVFAAFKE